jgi:hypothetical protein
VLTTQREVLDRLAALLIEKETIEGDEFEALFEGILPPRGTTPAPAIESEALGTPEGEAEPAEDGEAPKRRRGPAPQPA